MHIGAGFHDLYADPAFAVDMRERWQPWLLDGHGPAGDPPVDLGPDVLELAVGTSTRLAEGRVRGRLETLDAAEADPLHLPWPDADFSAVVATLVLHHLPDAPAQDAALVEWARVLRPGGVLVGLNPIDGPHMRRLDTDHRCLPVDPLTFPQRLTAAGYDPVVVRVWSLVGFTAHVEAAA